MRLILCRSIVNWSVEWESVHFYLSISDECIAGRKNTSKHLLLKYIRRRYIEPVAEILMCVEISYGNLLC